MDKRDIIQPAKMYVIRQYGINGELLFPEVENKRYFERLMQYHISKIGKILFYNLTPQSVQIILEIKAQDQIAQQYRTKLHQPISNLFNAYSKAFNKYKGRTGSLFTRNYDRRILWTPEELNMEVKKLLTVISENES